MDFSSGMHNARIISSFSNRDLESYTGAAFIVLLHNPPCPVLAAAALGAPMRVAMAAAPGQPEGVASLATPPSVPAPTPAEGGGGLVHAGHASVVNSQRWLLVTID